jgi:putative ABC transport system permease protein
MSLSVRPILSALLRNRTGAVLVTVQVAIALAVLVNCVYIVKQRIDAIRAPTGIDVPNIFVAVSAGFSNNFNREARIREDLAYLRGLDGVVAATVSTHVPLAGSTWDDVLTTEPNDTGVLRPADFYEMDHQGLAALGVQLAAGRAFSENQILPSLHTGDEDPFVPEVILTRAYAQLLFPNQNALGRVVYNRAGKPATIVGIVDRMKGGRADISIAHYNVIVPRMPSSTYSPTVYYIVRTKPGQRDNLLRMAEQHLTQSDPNRIVEWVRPLESYERLNHRDDRNMGIFLVAVTALMLIVTALGIFGLATFNVNTRMKQIGTRRALGARRLDIVRHFLIENGLVTTTGIVLGCGLSLAMGEWLSLHYGLPRLSLYYVLAGVVTIWIIGLAAAWAPAHRASSISPAIATRTV